MKATQNFTRMLSECDGFGVPLILKRQGRRDDKWDDYTIIIIINYTVNYVIIIRLQ